MENGTRLRELYEARRLDEAWSEYERLLAEGPVGAEEHVFGALTSRLLKDYREARRALERAEMTGPTGNTLGRLRLLTGNVLREIGDTTTAIEYYQAYIDGVDGYLETIPVCLGAAWYNLGLAYRPAKRLPEAIVCYQKAAEEFRKHDFPDYLRQALQNLAWTACLLGWTEKAAVALNEADGLCTTETARMQQQIGLALWESLTGAPHSALVTCERLIERAESIPPALVSQAHWLAGRIALQLGQYELASAMAQNAVDWSLKVKDDVRPMQDANQLRREIHQARVHKEEGA